MGELNKFWDGVNKGWRHIITSMNDEKKQRIVNRVKKNLLDHVEWDEVNRALDYGVGGGLLAKCILDDYTVESLDVADICEDSLNSAIEYLEGRVNSHLIDSDDISLAFDYNIDLILCNEVIQHFPSEEHFETVLAIWMSLLPKYLCLQIKTGTNTKAADNYSQGFLRGLVFSCDDFEKRIKSYGYEVVNFATETSKSDQTLGYYVFKKVN